MTKIWTPPFCKRRNRKFKPPSPNYAKSNAKNVGKQRNNTTEFSNKKRLKKLPDHYTDVLAAYLPPKITMPERSKLPVKISKANGMKDNEK